MVLSEFPFYLIPRKGSLALSASIVANTSVWQPEAECDETDSYCSVYTYLPSGFPNVVWDQGYSVALIGGAGVRYVLWREW